MNYSITNPPYNKGQHVDFVNLCTDVSNKTVAVHPATPIINMKQTKKQERDIKLLSNLDTYESSIELIDGNELFNALFLTPLSITEINTANKTDGVKVSGYYDAVLPTKEINQIGVWLNKFYSLDIGQSLHDVRNTKIGKFYVNIPQVRGGAPKPGKQFSDVLFTFVSRGVEVVDAKIDKPGWSAFGFDIKQEAENFLSYLKTKFARFMLALYKMNMQLTCGGMSKVPYLDFTQAWDDEKLFRHFKVSKADQQKILDFIPDYY